MRLKHIKGAEEIVNNSSYVIKNEQQYKGKFQELFNNNNDIYIEIGMGKGDFIINNAIRYPNINFIGIEKYDSVLLKAIKKLENKKIDNLKFIRMDALNIDDVFEKEITKVYLNFSDPWPKDRHAKRRLSSPIFLNKYDQLFKDVKTIEMKTDNRKLFEYSIKSFTDFGYKIDFLSLDLYNDNVIDNIPTEYETKFHNQGFLIYKTTVKKN